MTDSNAASPLSPFVERWIRSRSAAGLSGRRALDVACGKGRHALALAAAGFTVTGLDIQLDALQAARASARAGGLRLSLACADLTAMPLPRATFDVVLVTRYLDRALFGALREALVPGGLLLYETFTENQLRHGWGPRSRAHLLAPGELRTLITGMDVLFDEELTAPEAVARIAARRR